jgi:hypothetical protein
MPIMTAFALLAMLAQPSLSTAASLAGMYDGGQMEMAAGLELQPNGRFRYALSYGVLDEMAEGSWKVDGDRVLLTSDPFKTPRIALAEQRRAPRNELIVAFASEPAIPAQLFNLEVGFAKGRTVTGDMRGIEERWPIDRKDPPRTVRLALPMFGVVGETVPLDPSKGYRLSFRFEPNELGKVDFQATPLQVANGGLLLTRHDRRLRFRRVEPRE